MKKIILGHTGVVGTTLMERNKYDLLYNSSNINDFIHQVVDGDELTLCCLPATKWLVNKDPGADLNNIKNIIEIISQKKYSKVILISTIDVYSDSPLQVDENHSPNIKSLSYGSNRYLFELMVREYVKTDDLKIFRLPALFGKHIKKNILYDLLHDNNVSSINIDSSFQWYDLDLLNLDIQKYCEYYPSRTLFNFFTEPLHTSFILELFPHLKEKIIYFKHDSIRYDYKTIYSAGGYMYNKNQIFNSIKKFVDGFSSK